MTEEFEIDDDLHPIDPPLAGTCACACHHDSPLFKVAHVAPCCYPPITPGPLLADYLDKQAKANPVVGPWSGMANSARMVVLDWIIGTCLTFGASMGTAYQVAGMFASGLDRDAERTPPAASSPVPAAGETNDE